MEFSISGMKSFLKSQINKRVSRGSAEELGELMEEYGSEIAEDAIQFAEEDGRKTVRSEDIREAVRRRE